MRDKLHEIQIKNTWLFRILQPQHYKSTVRLSIFAEKIYNPIRKSKLQNIDNLSQTTSPKGKIAKKPDLLKKIAPKFPHPWQASCTDDLSWTFWKPKLKEEESLTWIFMVNAIRIISGGNNCPKYWISLSHIYFLTSQSPRAQRRHADIEQDVS